MFNFKNKMKNHVKIIIKENKTALLKKDSKLISEFTYPKFKCQRQWNTNNRVLRGKKRVTTWEFYASCYLHVIAIENVLKYASTQKNIPVSKSFWRK